MAHIRPDDDPLASTHLLAMPDVMRLLHVSRSLVFELIRRGELPVVHIGHALRFRPQDLRAYLERQAEACKAREAARKRQRRSKARP